MRRSLVFIMTILLINGAGAQETMMKSEKSASDGTRMKADDSVYSVGDLGPRVVGFTTEAAAWALARTQTVVYFFAATWCPDCQALYQDLRVNLKTLPAGMTVVFVNFDKSFDLKKKYGVTSQHSFVVVGPAGERKKAWAGSLTAAALVKASGLR